jgi:glycosyltransferase involved in cell wall biosynthesis
VLIVSLGATGGLRRADEELLAALCRAGTVAELVSVPEPAPVRTLVLTDLRWAIAARKAARAAIERARPRAVIYSSTTAALLWPRPGAIRFDAPAAGNRPGRHGLWQRSLERQRMRRSPLLLPWSEGAMMETPRSVRHTAVIGERALVLPVPIEPSDERDRLDGSAVDPRTPELRARRSGAPQPVRDIAAITYAANPTKKGLDRVLAAWKEVCKPGERLVVAGLDGESPGSVGLADASRGSSSGGSSGGPLGSSSGGSVGGSWGGSVEYVGSLPQESYRALLRRSRVFVCAARREDHGIAQLEALADGCMLVSVPSPGPYVALGLARELDGRLIDDDLAAALRTALDDPVPRYHERALRLLAPLRRSRIDRLVREELLPLLLATR